MDVIDLPSLITQLKTHPKDINCIHTSRAYVIIHAVAGDPADQALYTA
jgi:hypothetical protein